jgi:hypothetical protein
MCILSSGVDSGTFGRKPKLKISDSRFQIPDSRHALLRSGEFAQAANILRVGHAERGGCASRGDTALDLDEVVVRPVRAWEASRYQELKRQHHYLGVLPKIS